MPTYEYQCFACNHHFEQVQKISDEPVKVCPKCQSHEVKRLLSASAFHLKGSGWYKTDYAASGSSGIDAKTNSSSSETPSSGESSKSSDSAGKEAGSGSSTKSEPVSTPAPAKPASSSES